MAATVEGKIPEALFTRLKAFSTEYEIAWPGMKFDPPNSNKFWRIDYVPNTVVRSLIGSSGPSQHLGLLMVNLFWPKLSGEIEPRDLAGRVAAWFPADLYLSRDGIRVRITQKPVVGDTITTDERIQIPVTIRWECWA